ncbi:uncharacterized protein L969DRAFT_25316 [Mixia osmundae IAM 14324]|uniref:Methyltransferase domain-containing protein n=1 Tax=Mixia osmundae (strain CBS 9802 / IAM 14324 / JCM 22182 / KY 12970) TaxID=764103 RepID=G7DWZ7_MIXOS|nr:uncharacterized protein L969DRAFT_25316 [Mixia osmundae IAM 14324]KEI38097.1 hypothetical protein L969DRAFT_25316 [Mixia osmundae IAM 14324]GAA95094.1 hypothetical protein E5Q_01749 [Mixia osmundae IAM 14324]
MLSLFEFFRRQRKAYSGNLGRLSLFRDKLANYSVNFKDTQGVLDRNHSSALYNEVSAQDIATLERLTGLCGQELKDHVLNVQNQAYAIGPWPCVEGLYFLKGHMKNHPFYSTMLGQAEKSDALLCEVATFMGIEVRKAIMDGYPASNIIGTDLHQGFIDAGFSLFGDRVGQRPAFVSGDFFDSALLNLDASSPVSELTDEKLNLKQLNSLTPLVGRCTFVYAALFIHLFDLKGQREAIKRLAALLKPEKGATVFGRDSNGVTPGTAHLLDPAGQRVMLNMPAMSAGERKAAWEDALGAGTVSFEQIDTPEDDLYLSSHIRGAASVKITWALWTVTRL